MPGFDRDAFVADCVQARAETDPLAALAEVVARAVAAPDPIASSVSLPLDPDDDGVLFRSPDLLIVQVLFPAQFVTGIHDHRVPAVIGTWAGYEDNLIYRRDADRLVRREVRRLEPSDVLALGADDAHDVHAPLGSWTGGLHVYLGDIDALARGQWDGPDAKERPFDGAGMERQWTTLAQASGLIC